MMILPQPLRTAKTWLANIPGVDWAWIHFKFALGILWPFLTLSRLPTSIEVQLQDVMIYVWLGLTVLGACACIAGIVMYAQAGTKWRPIGSATELVGLILMLLGPTLFTMVYLYLALFTTEDIRPTVIGLGYALSSAVFARMCTAWPRFRAEARDESKKV